MAKRNSSKEVPKSQTDRPVRKEVRIEPIHRDGKPSWRFSTVDKSGPFSWPSDDKIRVEILDKLHSFDSMLWSNILGSDHHAISVERLSTEAQKRLKEIRQDDIDEIVSFHLSGKKRLICIRVSDVAKVLWYDPEHQVCPSKKKHT